MLLAVGDNMTFSFPLDIPWKNLGNDHFYWRSAEELALHFTNKLPFLWGALMAWHLFEVSWISGSRSKYAGGSSTRKLIFEEMVGEGAPRKTKIMSKERANLSPGIVRLGNETSICTKINNLVAMIKLALIKWHYIKYMAASGSSCAIWYLQNVRARTVAKTTLHLLYHFHRDCEHNFLCRLSLALNVQKDSRFGNGRPINSDCRFLCNPWPNSQVYCFDRKLSVEAVSSSLQSAVDLVQKIKTWTLFCPRFNLECDFHTCSKSTFHHLHVRYVPVNYIAHGNRKVLQCYSISWLLFQL